MGTKTNWTYLIAPGLIDSYLKLRLLLVFIRHRQLRGPLASLAQRLPGNPWALEEALDALAEAGLLERARTVGAPEYALASSSEHRMSLAHLALSFDDPHQRDEIYALVHAAEQERRFHEALADRRAIPTTPDSYEPVVV
jgi:hypothetical protein